jgi:deazaflavin-dependent oxidoreductase (nitroreductase family)
VDRSVGLMPSDLALKTMNTVHRALLKASGGRIGWKVGGMTVVELTTTGRKSGQPRTVMLTSPTRAGDAMVVVASRGGADQPPAWFLNLRDQPNVEVAVGGKPRQPMRARIASPEERSALWPRVTAAYRGYANYQTKTERVIPLVLLESPAGAAT